MELDIDRILRILPHRAPFLLIDRVTELSPRKSARGIKCVTYGEPALQGHFPGQPMLPGVLVLESMSQLLALLAYASEPYDTTQKVFWLLGFDAAKLRRPVVPGDRMVVEVEITQRRSNIWKAKGTATVGEHLVAQAELLASLTDRDQLPPA